MARKGNGSSDSLVSSSFAQLTDYSWVIRYKNDSVPGSGGISQPFGSTVFSTPNYYGFNMSWDHSNASFRGAAAHHDGSWTAISFGSLSADTWYSLGASFDGTNVRSYQDGVLQNTSGTVSDPTAGTAQVEFLSSGYGSASYDDGEVAEAAIWNTPLTAAEYLMHSAGVSALKIRPQNLVNYWQLIGNNSPETDIVGGNNLTVTGTTKTSHPRIILPSQQIFTPIAAAAGGATGKSNPFNGPFGGPFSGAIA